MLDIKRYQDKDRLRIIIGAGDQQYDGWIATHKQDLDLTNDQDWFVTFKDRKADAFLCEHVWEHLSLSEGKKAAKYVFDSLKPGGYIRVAVPDKNFKNDNYQETIKVGGPGPKNHSASDHKIVYDYKLFSKIFEQAGFRVNLLEYCDEYGQFHYNHWDLSKGFIYRTYRNDHRNDNGELNFLSLLIDAKKPE